MQSAIVNLDKYTMPQMYESAAFAKYHQKIAIHHRKKAEKDIKQARNEVKIPVSVMKRLGI